MLLIAPWPRHPCMRRVWLHFPPPVPLCGFQHVQLCLCLSLFNKRGREDGGWGRVLELQLFLCSIYSSLTPLTVGSVFLWSGKRGGGETRWEVAEVTEEFYNRWQLRGWQMKSMAHMAAIFHTCVCGCRTWSILYIIITKYIEDHVEIQITTIHFFFLINCLQIKRSISGESVKVSIRVGKGLTIQRN